MKSRRSRLIRTTLLSAAAMMPVAVWAAPLPTTIDGGNAAGSVVSGTQTINDSIYTNFRTTGTTGTTGGAGAGGAIHVTSTGNLTLNNVSFSGNTAVGGTGTAGNGGNGLGGALYVENGGRLTLTGNGDFADTNKVLSGSGSSGFSGGLIAGTNLFMEKGSVVTLAPGAGKTITFNGTIADDSQSSLVGAINGVGAGAGLEIASGTVVFNAANTYSGQTKITGGVLRANDGTGVNTNSNINFAGTPGTGGGVLETTGSFTRFIGTAGNQVQWTGDGGFAAIGGALNVRLNAGAQMVWNANGFVTTGSALVFGSASSTDNVTFTNAIDLAGLNGKVLVTPNTAGTNKAIMTGVISGGSLTVGDAGHTGVLELTQANSINGGTTVNGGTLTLTSGARLSSLATLTINGGTVDFSRAGAQVVTVLTGVSGTTLNLGVNGLTVNSGSFAGTITGVDATSGLTKVSLGELILSGQSTYLGETHVTNGTLTLASGATLESRTVTVDANMTLNSNFGGLSSQSALVDNGHVYLGAGDDTVDTFAGSGTLHGTATLTARTYTLNDGARIEANLGAGSLTVSAASGALLLGTSAAETVHVVAGGVLTLNSAERLLDTAAVTVDGRLVLGGAETIGSLTGTNTGFVTADTGVLTVSSGNFAGVIEGNNADYGLTKVSSGELILSGANTYLGTTSVQGGTLTLAQGGSLESRVIDIASGTTVNNTVSGFSSLAALTNAGTLNLGAGDDTVDTLVNSGTINGASRLTALTYALNDGSVVNANLGAGDLTTDGTVALNGDSRAENFTVLGGVTTLGSADRLLDTATLKVDGKLVLGGDEKISVLLGTGEIDVSAGVLTVSEGTFDGVLSGALPGEGAASGLTKVDTGLLTLNGESTYLGTTHLTKGAIDLNGSLASRTVVIDEETIFNDNNGGLAADAAVTVNGTLNVNNSDSIGALTGSGSVFLDEVGFTVGSGDFSGVISGLADFVKDTDGTLTLSGVNTFDGSVSVAAGELILTGSLAALDVSVDSGALLTSAHAGLSTNATLTNSGTVDIGAADQTILHLENSGVIDGSATLTASEGYALHDGSVVNANLGEGELTVDGAATLNGTSAAGTVDIAASGVLTLGSAERLADTAAVTLEDTTSRLVLGGDEKIGSLSGAGTVDVNAGSLTVTAVGQFYFTGDITGTHGLVLDGVGIDNDGPLTELVLTGDTTYTGETRVVNGGLIIGGANASTSLFVGAGSGLALIETGFEGNPGTGGSLASGATLTNEGGVWLGTDNTIAAYISNGGTLNLGFDNSVHTLTAATYALNDGSVVDANLGTGIVTANGIVALNGTSAASEFTVATGTTTFGSANRLVGILGETGPVTLTVASEATLVLGGDEVVTTLNGGGTVGFTGEEPAGLTVFNGEFSGDIAGDITLNKESEGMLSLSGANSFTGAANINGGVLTLTGSLATDTVNIASGATLSDVNGGLTDNSTVRVDGTLALGANETIGSLHGAGEITLGDSTLTVSGGWFRGAINSEGSGGLTLAGGYLGLTGDSGYTGTTTVSSGILSLRGTLASLVVNVAEGATLDDRSGGLTDAVALTVDGTANLGSAETVASLAGSGIVDLGANAFTVSSGDFSGALNGTGDFTKVSEGTLTLSGVNTYTGATRIDAGTLVLTGSLASTTVGVAAGATLTSAHSGLAAETVLTNAGTVDLGSANQTVATYESVGATLNGSGTLTAATYTFSDRPGDEETPAVGSVVNANLGTGIMDVNGTVTLAGTSAAETINIAADSILKLVSAERLSDTATVNLDGEIQLLGGDETIGVLNGSGTISAGLNRLIVLNGGNFSGNLVITTPGLLVSEGNLTLSGETTVTGGTVQVQNNSTLTITAPGTLTANEITIDAGSTLHLDSSGIVSYGLLHGAGIVEFGGTFVNVGLVKGWLTFDGDFRNEGSFKPGNSPGITVIAGNYTEAGVIEMELAGNGGVAGTDFDQVRIGGTGTLTASGSLVVQGFGGFVPARGQTFQIYSDASGNPIGLSGALGSVTFDLDGVAGSGLAVSNAAAVLDVAKGRVITTGLNAPTSTFAQLGADANQGAAASAIVNGALIGQNQIDSSTVAGAAAESILLSTAANAGTNLAFFVPTSYSGLLDYGMDSSHLAERLNSRVNNFNAFPGTGSGNGAFYAGAINAETSTSHDARFSRNDFYAGADFGVSDSLALGLFVNKSEGSVRSSAMKAKDDGIGGGAYLKAAVTDRVSVKASFTYANDEFDIDRRTLAGAVKGDANVDTYSGAVSVEYVAYNDNGFTIAPRVGVVGSEAQASAFTESGANDALHLDRFSSTRVSARAGASATWTKSIFSLELTGDLDQALYAEATDLDVSLAGARSVRYPLTPADDKDTSFIYGANAGVAVSDSVSLFVGYQGRVGYLPSNDVNISVRVRF